MTSQIANASARQNADQHQNTDWDRVWSQFTEGMRQMTEAIRQMEQTYQNTFVWDRPISR
jgi:hypothetical protein